MPFKKEDPRINRGGRPAGSKNKVKHKVKDVIAAALEEIGEDISKVEPYQEGVAHCTLSAEKLAHFREKFPLGPDWDKYTVQ